MTQAGRGPPPLQLDVLDGQSYWRSLPTGMFGQGIQHPARIATCCGELPVFDQGEIQQWRSVSDGRACAGPGNHDEGTLGDAEIAMRAKSKGCSGTDYSATNWESVNNSGDQWYGSRNLGLTQCDVVFYWWEDDGGSFDFTLSYGGFSLGTKMDNSDDLIGGKQLPYSSFAGSTNRTDEWPALTMRTQ